MFFVVVQSTRYAEATFSGPLTISPYRAFYPHLQHSLPVAMHIINSPKKLSSTMSYTSNFIRRRHWLCSVCVCVPVPVPNDEHIKISRCGTIEQDTYGSWQQYAYYFYCLSILIACAIFNPFEKSDAIFGCSHLHRCVASNVMLFMLRVYLLTHKYAFRIGHDFRISEQNAFIGFVSIFRAWE